MKIYIVMKAYWMYQAEIDKIFKNKKQAEEYKNTLNHKDMIHSYIIEKKVK